MIATLEGRWTTRIVVLPEVPPITGGPYRFLRHPNYLAVILEILSLPLVHTAWLTALVFSVLNALAAAGAHPGRGGGAVADDRLRRGFRRPAPPGAGGPMSDDVILAGIAEVARLHLGWEGALTPEMRLVEDLRLDSIRLLTLAAEVENRFRVLLDEVDEMAIETVGDLVALVRRKLSG